MINLFKVQSLPAIIRLNRSRIKKCSSCPANIEKFKIIQSQIVESVVEESVEYSQTQDPIYKMLTVIILNFMNFKELEIKITEITMKLIIQYMIHQLFMYSKYVIIPPPL